MISNQIESLNFSGEGHFEEWAIAAHKKIDELENYIANIKPKNPISDKANIHPTAIIGENVIICDDVKIGPYCYVRSNTILMEKVQLGYNVEVDRCILFNEVKIAHTSCVGRCIIGSKSNLAFGFVIATKNIFGKQVKVNVPGSSYLSTRNHHGAVIGSNFKCGVNVVVMPGTSIGKDVIVGSTKTLKGYVPNNTVII